jgi:hypothetical protein
MAYVFGVYVAIAWFAMHMIPHYYIFKRDSFELIFFKTI